MARPIKNNADYFPHDADMRNDPRIKALRRKFGIEGYGIYCMLLELLTDSDFFEFKSDSFNIEIIAGDFDLDPDRLNEVLRYICQIDLIQLDKNLISCKSLDNRLEPLLSKRKRDRIELSTAITQQNGVIDSESTQSKVKESKGNKSKVHESIGKGEFFLFVKAKYLNDKIKKVHDLKMYFETTGQWQQIEKAGWGAKISDFMKENPGAQFDEDSHLYNTFRKFATKPTEINGKKKSFDINNLNLK